MGEYLIPANAKSGKLIFGIFTPRDLIIFGVGIGISFLMLAFIPANSLKEIVLILMPGAISSFLIVPVPNYHNILSIILSGVNFFRSNRVYIWRGWSFVNERKK